MAHGTPDWWGAQPKEHTYALEDMGELAARLGSPVTWDRRGDVIMIDDFEESIERAMYTPYGTGGGWAWLTDRARWGALCLKLIGASDSYACTTCRWRLPLPPLSGLGFETSFGFDPTVDYIDWYIDYYNGTTRTMTVVIYTPDTNTLEIWDEQGARQTITTSLDLYQTLDPTHSLKVVGDYVNSNHVRVIVNQHTYDTSAYKLYVSADPSSPRMAVVIGVHSIPGYNAAGYFDGIIVTQNEPT